MNLLNDHLYKTRQIWRVIHPAQETETMEEKLRRLIHFGEKIRPPSNKYYHHRRRTASLKGADTPT